MTKGNVIIRLVLSFLHPQNGLPGARSYFIAYTQAQTHTSTHQVGWKWLKLLLFQGHCVNSHSSLDQETTMELFIVFYALRTMCWCSIFLSVAPDREGPLLYVFLHIFSQQCHLVIEKGLNNVLTGVLGLERGIHLVKHTACDPVGVHWEYN